MKTKSKNRFYSRTKSTFKNSKSKINNKINSKFKNSLLETTSNSPISKENMFIPKIIVEGYSSGVIYSNIITILFKVKNENFDKEFGIIENHKYLNETFTNVKKLGILTDNILYTDLNQIPIEKTYNPQSDLISDSNKYIDDGTDNTLNPLNKKDQENISFIGESMVKIFTDNYYIAKDVENYLKKKNYIHDLQIIYRFRRETIHSLKNQLKDLAIADAANKTQSLLNPNVSISNLFDYFINYDEDSGVLFYSTEEYIKKYSNKEWIKVINCNLTAIFDLQENITNSTNGS